MNKGEAGSAPIERATPSMFEAAGQGVAMSTGGTYANVRFSMLVVALLGSLLPTIMNVPVSVPAAASAALLVLYETLTSWTRNFRLIRVMTALILVLAASALWAPPTTEYGSTKLLRLLTFTLLAALSGCLVRGLDELPRLAWVWILASGALSLFVLAGGQNLAGRTTAFDANPIWLARALAVGIVFGLWLLIEKRIAVPVGAGLLATQAVAIYATGSRGPMIGAVIGVVVLSSLSRRGRGARLVVAALISVVAVVAIDPSASYGARIAHLLVEPQRDVSTLQRQQMLELTAPVVAENSSGVGLGNWSYAAGFDNSLWPHNLFVEVFAESGWLVGSVLVSIVCAAIWGTWRRAQWQPAARVVCALLMAESFSVSVSGDVNARTFFAVLSLAVLVCSEPRVAPQREHWS